MNKYFILIATCGISMFVVGIVAGIILYVTNDLNDEIALIVLTLIFIGLLISGIGIKLLDWRKNDRNI